MDDDFSQSLEDGRAGLAGFLDRLEAFLERSGAPAAAVGAVMIAADEVVSNVLDYGGAGRVDLSVQAHEGRLRVCVTDDGRPFDLTAATTPDTTLSVDARDVGGLGIHLVREMMQDVRYTREGDTNKLCFSRLYDAVSPSRRA